MKRHPALEPFSRDHNDGLILARRLTLSAHESLETRAATADLFLEAWRRELKDHFDEEERLLGDLLTPEDRKQLHDEHDLIEDHTAALETGDLTPSRLEALAQSLHDHIRWEERYMFGAIEKTATEEQLERLAKETLEVEMRRWPDNKRREELVKRRL